MRWTRRATAKSDGGKPEPGRRKPRQVSRIRDVPLLRLVLYYIVIVAAAVGLAFLLPIARHAFVAPINAPALDQAGELLGRGEAARGITTGAPEAGQAFSGTLDRAVITMLVIVGAFALALPIAWVAMFTRRLRYDPSLVHSIIVLPIVAAGIVILVKNSLALAFSLAGIVAVVRFRNTLKDPRDAVYIFLVLGVGLAAGVQALDVALIVSLAFNLLVLGLWKYDVGGFYSAAGHGGLLTIGDPTLLPLNGLREGARERRRAQKLAQDMETDGYLLIVAADVAAARRCVEITLTGYARNWRVSKPNPQPGGLASFMVALDLRDKSSPVDVLGDLDERWPEQIAAAEYLPFRHEAEDDDEED